MEWFDLDIRILSSAQQRVAVILNKYPHRPSRPDFPKQDFRDLNVTVFQAASYEVVLALLRQKLQMDGFEETYSKQYDADNRTMFMFKVPEYLQDYRVLRLYVRDWLNTFDRHQIWMEQQELV